MYENVSVEQNSVHVERAANAPLRRLASPAQVRRHATTPIHLPHKPPPNHVPPYADTPLRRCTTPIWGLRAVAPFPRQYADMPSHRFAVAPKIRRFPPANMPIRRYATTSLPPRQYADAPLCRYTAPPFVSTPIAAAPIDGRSARTPLR